MLWATRQSALRLHRSYGWHAFSSTSILRAQQRAPEVRTSRPPRASSTSRLAEEVEGLEKIVDAMGAAPNSRGGKESISYEAENLSIYKEGRDPVITVRLPRRINSLLEVYAIVRAVEDKYGRVKDFKVSRDRELISEYLFVVNFVLEDPSAILQEPHLSAGNSENLEVHIPGHSSSDLLRGGVSLVDLYHVLGRGGNYEDLIKELKENDAWKNPDKIVVAKLRVERPDERKEVFTTVTKPVSKFRIPRRGRMARAFVAWGGFAPQPSSDPGLTALNSAKSEEERDSTLKGIHRKRPTMKSLLEKHTQYIRMLDKSDRRDRALPRLTEEERDEKPEDEPPYGASEVRS